MFVDQPCTGMLTSVTPVRQSPLTCYSVILNSWDTRVRYVRNITDVGHLVNDADEGEDKIAKKAKLEQLEPMEVVQFYSNRYHKNMEQLNTLPPSIEPHASGHIIEQQELIKQIIENGFAYESEGNIYFDVERYNQKYHYGKLSGRKIEPIVCQHERTERTTGKT